MKRKICSLLCAGFFLFTLSLATGKATTGGDQTKSKMYEYKQFGNQYVIRLNKGAEIVKSLDEFCTEHKIILGKISGLGAINKVTMRFFNPATKKYVDKTIEKPMEITSLIGNISTQDGKTYLHLHINVAGDDYVTYGGHLLDATISATGELYVEAIDGKVERTFSEDIGLNLYDFNK